jgi:hypothetical protein
VVDGSTHVARQIDRSCVTALAVRNVVGSAQPEIVSGSCDGAIEVIDASNGSVLQTHSVCSGPISALADNRLSTAGPHEFLFSCGERIGWISLATGASRILTAVVGDQLAWGGGLFSTGSSAATDRILVTTTFGVAQLRPVASLAPYVEPFNPTTTNIFATQSGTPLDSAIRFGSFDGSAVTLEAATQPQHGTLAVMPSGGFRYEPQATFAGTDMLVVRARTATGVSVMTAIPVQVSASPGPPPPPPPPTNPPPTTPPPATPPPQQPTGGGGGGGQMGWLTLVLLLFLTLYKAARLHRPI